VSRDRARIHSMTDISQAYEANVIEVKSLPDNSRILI